MLSIPPIYTWWWLGERLFLAFPHDRHWGDVYEVNVQCSCCLYRGPRNTWRLEPMNMPLNLGTHDGLRQGPKPGRFQTCQTGLSENHGTSDYPTTQIGKLRIGKMAVQASIFGAPCFLRDKKRRMFGFGEAKGPTSFDGPLHSHWLIGFCSSWVTRFCSKPSGTTCYYN